MRGAAKDASGPVSIRIEASPISKNVSAEFERNLTFGERLSDKVAEIGGSWTFIAFFGAFLVAWALFNTWALAAAAFDPYPYVFLNLILSMLAAVQAPIIMMSQNRQAAKDRMAAAHDYEVNLKAELEIVGLHDKLDEIRTRHLADLLATQQQQIALLTRLLAERQPDESPR